MPIRSSLCTYSPLSASNKYSAGSSSASRSSVLPASSNSLLSYGLYKPLGSRTGSAGYESATSLASSSPRSAASSTSNSTRYSSSSSYSPASVLSSSSYSTPPSTTGLYRPLSSASTSGGSFNSGDRPNITKTTPSTTTTSSNRYSVSNSSLSSTSSDYLSPTTSSYLNRARQPHNHLSSSAYSSASLSSNSSNSNRYHHQPTSPSYTSPSRARRTSYTVMKEDIHSLILDSQLINFSSGHHLIIKCVSCQNYWPSSAMPESSTEPPELSIWQSHSSLSSLSSGFGGAYSAIEPLPDGVPNGLINLGNTCYMNASLQALFAIDPFRNLLISSSGHARLDMNKVLTSELSDLFRRMKESSRRGHQAKDGGSSTESRYQHSTGLNPTALKQAFARYQSKFSGYGQQDAQEFLRYLINGIHEESNKASSRLGARSAGSTISSSSPPPPPAQPSRSPPAAPRNCQEAWSRYQSFVDNSPFVDILVGQLCSTITCSQCRHKSHCWDPFWDLSLPLAGTGSSAGGGVGRFRCNLLDLLNEFTSKETLDSDERPQCEHCKRATRSTKQISLARLPQVLILHLKKFTNDGYKMSSPEVEIETVLRFDEQKVVYNLKACISHHGHSSSSGHYTSHCEYSGKWYHFDDDRVREAASNFSGSSLDDAYVLFYARQSSRSCPSKAALNTTTNTTTTTTTEPTSQQEEPSFMSYYLNKCSI